MTVLDAEPEPEVVRVPLTEPVEEEVMEPEFESVAVPDSVQDCELLDDTDVEPLADTVALAE